jgi:GT2 family glycosyltransferase
MEKDRRDHNGRNGVSVSIVIPAYNCVEYVPTALDSAFAQTFTDFEVVLVNDGSPDTEMLEHLIAPYRNRIIYLKQENRGPSAARNAGIRAARGKYLAFLDSDDCWPPEYLAAQMKLFEETPSLDLVYADALIFRDASFPYKRFVSNLSQPVTFEDLLLKGCQIIPSATVARKQVIVDSGLFDESLRRVEDYDLWLRLVYRGAKLAYQPSALILRRFHSGALTSDPAKLLQAEEQVLTKLVKTLKLPEGTRFQLLRRLGLIRAWHDLERGKQNLVLGDADRARESLASAHTFIHHMNWRDVVMSSDRNPFSEGGRVRSYVRRAKLRVALWGLRIAPRLTVFGARTWGNFLQE